LSDPEAALSAVETRPALPAVAGVDWPKGQGPRVISLDPNRLGLRISSERDWLRVSGQARLDEGLVLDFKTLLDAAQGRSRFIPMGEGVYAALTRGLKERLADLAAVAEPTLQTELRPYQGTAMSGLCAWPPPASGPAWRTTGAWARPSRPWRCYWPAAAAAQPPGHRPPLGVRQLAGGDPPLRPQPECPPLRRGRLGAAGGRRRPVGPGHRLLCLRCSRPRSASPAAPWHPPGTP
jgi:hypothetical protein